MKFDHKKEKKNLPLLNIFCQKHCFESFVAFKQLIESSFISAETLKYTTALQIFETILIADAIEMGTHKMLEPAIRGMINVLALTVLIFALIYFMVVMLLQAKKYKEIFPMRVF